MDQVHLPDPVKEDITVLQHENAELVNRVLDLEKEDAYFKHGSRSVTGIIRIKRNGEYQSGE